MKRYVLAITGATGSVIGIRVLKELINIAEVHLLISAQSFRIIRAEAGFDWEDNTQEDIQKKIRTSMDSENIFYHDEHNMHAPVSSGSFQTQGMFIVPCSMKTLAGIATGYTENLIQRAADVTIKEGRNLVISPREMPFSAIHLENMLKLARLGVKVAPPVLGFYHEPRDIDDLVKFITGKLLDAMRIEHNIYRRWGLSD